MKTKSKPKTKPKTKPKSKSKTETRPAATPAPQPTQVDIKTITKAQIAELKRLSIEAGDDAMLVEIRAALDPKSSARRRKAALEECVRLHNDLLSIANG